MSLDLGSIDMQELTYTKYVPDIALEYQGRITKEEITQGLSYLQTAPLQERIRLIGTSQDNKTSTYVIDNVLRVQVPSEDSCKQNVEHWQKEQKEAQTKSRIFLALTIISGAGSVASYFALAVPNPLLVSAFAVAGVAFGIFAAIHYSSSLSASCEVDFWKKSPACVMAEHRKIALEKGFLYALQKDLKLAGLSNKGLLHFDEVSYLFDQYFQNFCHLLLQDQPFSSQQKKEWIDRFKDYSPISYELLTYAYGFVPEKFVQVSKDFESMNAFLKNLKKEFEGIKKQRKEYAKAEIANIEKEQNLMVLPLDLGLEHFKNSARNARNQALDQVYPGDLDRIREIEKEYTNSCRKYEMFYHAAVAVILTQYKARIRNVEERLQEELHQINQNEASQAATYYSYARGMMEYADNLFRGNSYNYQGFNPQNMTAFVTPSAPPFDSVFPQQNWNSVPDEIDPRYSQEFLNFVQFSSR